jgi:hypothetical protein
MMAVMEAGSSKDGSSKTLKVPTAFTINRSNDSKRDGDDNKKKGKDKKGGKGKSDDSTSNNSGGSGHRTGAVATNEAKRPPKWKFIVAGKYRAFIENVWAPSHSPLARYIYQAASQVSSLHFCNPWF